LYDNRFSALQLGETIVTTSLRRPADDIRQFEAPSSLAHNLQGVLVDLVELHLQGKQAHWNVIGTNFRDLHLQLDEIVDIARGASDTIAERMRALNAVPDGRSDTVVASTTLPAYPPGEQNTTETVDLITNRIYATVGTIRTVHDTVDAVDPTTSDLLHEVIDSLEKQAWMIKSENRKV
jgi:starvation-inducible DNA-binding protein